MEDEGNTEFEDNIRKMMLDEISNIRLTHLREYALDNQDTLKTIYGNGILDDANIENALEKPMLIQLWVNYKMLSTGLVPLENLYKPELIAYALENDMFSEEQLTLIPLNHDGDTLLSIIKMYGQKDLFSSLKDELLNPKPNCY
ncbi:MAG: hypothetical protein K0B07_05215 [DPANN group archaeon]|nr:hypothetical protein [DPANN group archaeon]